MSRPSMFAAFAVSFGLASAAGGASLVVRPPSAARVQSAVVSPSKDAAKLTPGTVAGDTVTFADLRPGVGYDVRLTLTDGTVLQGVDLGWYSRVPDRPDAGPLTDDDRRQMADVAAGVLSFFNRADPVIVTGTHNRAVMLVDLRRDRAFHSDAGGEMIWRPELWYFENHHGGWEKVQQTDRNLRRERFPTAAAYHATVDRLRWVPELGGLKVKAAGADVAVTVAGTPGVPATRPVENPRKAGG